MLVSILSMELRGLLDDSEYVNDYERCKKWKK